MKRSRALVLGLLATWWLAAPAFAGWGSAGAGWGNAAATTVQPPTISTLTNDCVVASIIPLRLLSQKVVLVWAPSTSTFVDGQQIRRGTTSGGPYNTVVVSGLGPGITTYTDAGSISVSTTYYYVIRATFSGWTGQSTQRSITTPNALCV